MKKHFSPVLFVLVLVGVVVCYFSTAKKSKADMTTGLVLGYIMGSSGDQAGPPSGGPGLLVAAVEARLRVVPSVGFNPEAFREELPQALCVLRILGYKVESVEKKYSVCPEFVTVTIPPGVKP